MKRGRFMCLASIILAVFFQTSGFAEPDQASVLEDRLKSAPQSQKAKIAGELGQSYLENAAARFRSGDEQEARKYFEKYNDTQRRMAAETLQAELAKLKKQYAQIQKRKEAQTARRLAERERYIGYLLGVLAVLCFWVFRMKRRDRQALADQETKLREALKALQSAQRRLEEAERTADVGDLAIDHIRQIIPELTELREKLTPLTTGTEDGNDPSGDPAAELEKIIAKLNYFRQVAGF
jgi:hypothetical protein